jgi:hypothetical protein
VIFAVLSQCMGPLTLPDCPADPAFDRQQCASASWPGASPPTAAGSIGHQQQPRHIVAAGAAATLCQRCHRVNPCTGRHRHTRWGHCNALLPRQ